MIVPMKKVTVVCLAAELESALDRLADLGVLHLAAVDRSENPDVAAASALIRQSEQVRIALKTSRDRKQTGGPAVMTADAIIAETQDIIRRKKELQDRENMLSREISSIAPMGDFDPEAVRRLGNRGIIVQFFFIGKSRHVRLPDDVVLIPLKTDGYIAAVSTKRVELSATELSLPARSLSAARADLEAAKKESASCESRLKSLAGQAESIGLHIESLEERLSFAKARAGAGRASMVAYVQGYCPVDTVSRIEAAVPGNGWGLLVGDPAETDPVPVKIRNPAFVRPIESLFNLVKILPGYRELDVSVFFLLFISIFFGMIMGDAGYGAIYLLATMLAWRKFRTAPRDPFLLLTIFSVATIAWGIMTGVYFGVPTDVLPAPLRGMQVPWLANDSNVMLLCFLIGAIHLTIAHLWNVIRMRNSTVALSQLGWAITVWTLFFLARNMLLNVPIPSYWGPVGIAGILLVVLFMIPLSKLKTEWPNFMMFPLSLASGFGDILSYLRLFALGLASLQFERAFYTIAVDTIGFNGVIPGIIAAIVLFGTHALNIFLSSISVLVHGIRLNALEFSMHLGLEWSGSPYMPFARKKGLKTN